MGYNTAMTNQTIGTLLETSASDVVVVNYQILAGVFFLGLALYMGARILQRS